MFDFTPNNSKAVLAENTILGNIKRSALNKLLLRIELPSFDDI